MASDVRLSSPGPACLPLPPPLQSCGLCATLQRTAFSPSVAWAPLLASTGAFTARGLLDEGGQRVADAVSMAVFVYLSLDVVTRLVAKGVAAFRYVH
jgi:hypothetical protein